MRTILRFFLLGAIYLFCLCEGAVLVKVEVRGPAPGSLHRTRLSLEPESGPMAVFEAIQASHPDWVASAVPSRLLGDGGLDVR